MQNDLDANLPALDIQILGVNGAGLEVGNGSITAGRNIPWLQDFDGNLDGMSDVWRGWAVTYRDVVILDAQNASAAVFNLTTHDLGVPDNYDALRRTLVDVASVPEPASLVLLIIGTAGLAARVGRRKNT